VTLKILTLNIHKGFAALNRENTLARLKDALRDAEVDVAFLQEVVGKHDAGAVGASGVRANAAPTQPQFEFLADTVWPHFAYGRNALYPTKHHGNAILSKFPITTWRHENLSTNRFEDRGLLHCTITVPKTTRPVHLICVHLGLTQGGRTAQIRQVAQHVAQHVPAASPLVLAGDFNDWRRKASSMLFVEAGMVEAHEALHGAPAKTFPVALPLVAVDRIYLRQLKPMSARALTGERWKKLSDHAGLTAVVEI
jgi:endonuclease/exonuclease/phosphatase family metal-dependent hydrolase